MKLKNILQGKIFPAAVIALFGAWVSLLVCTIIGESGVVKCFLPFWLFLFFTVSDIVLDRIPLTAKWKWFKPVALVAEGAVVLLAFAVLNALVRLF